MASEDERRRRPLPSQAQPLTPISTKRAHRLSLHSTAGIEAEEKDAASLRPDWNGRSRDALTVQLFLKAINE
jgi:hypothetical protein